MFEKADHPRRDAGGHVMKYSIDLSRHETRSVEVFADSPEEALRRAEDANHGFRVEGLVELLDEGVTGTEHTPASRCEACRRVIWVGQQCVHSEDADLCMECSSGAPELQGG